MSANMFDLIYNVVQHSIFMQCKKHECV